MKKISQSKKEILSVCLNITNAYYGDIDEDDEKPIVCLELYSKDPLFTFIYELVDEERVESIYKQLHRALDFSELFEPHSPEDYINKRFCAVVELSKEQGTIEILGIYDVDYSKEVANG